jgi:type II secretory pathway component PulJ
MSDEGGFTLIEALVALALGVSVVAVVLSTLRIASNGATRAVAVAAEAETFARAGAVLVGDAMHALKLRNARGTAIFTGQPLQVSFPATPRFVRAVPLIVRYDLRPAVNGTDLVRSEAALLAEGLPGPASPGQTIWHGAGQWELRYLDDKSAWRRDWSLADLPRAFGLVALNAPQTVELVAAFPALVEPECALGPGEACSLPATAFP